MEDMVCRVVAGVMCVVPPDRTVIIEKVAAYLMVCGRRFRVTHGGVIHVAGDYMGRSGPRVMYAIVVAIARPIRPAHSPLMFRSEVGENSLARHDLPGAGLPGHIMEEHEYQRSVIC